MHKDLGVNKVSDLLESRLIAIYMHTCIAGFIPHQAGLNSILQIAFNINRKWVEDT